MVGGSTISIIMSQRLLPRRRKRGATALIAITAAGRRIRSGPSSIPCWTSDSGNELTLSRLMQGALMKTWAIAGMAGLLVIVAARGQMSTRVSSDVSKADAVVAENLQVPE